MWENQVESYMIDLLNVGQISGPFEKHFIKSVWFTQSKKTMIAQITAVCEYECDNVNVQLSEIC